MTRTVWARQNTTVSPVRYLLFTSFLNVCGLNSCNCLRYLRVERGNDATRLFQTNVNRNAPRGFAGAVSWDDGWLAGRAGTYLMCRSAFTVVTGRSHAHPSARSLLDSWLATRRKKESVAVASTRFAIEWISDWKQHRHGLWPMAKCKLQAWLVWSMFWWHLVSLIALIRLLLNNEWLTTPPPTN